MAAVFSFQPCSTVHEPDHIIKSFAR